MIELMISLKEVDQWAAKFLAAGFEGNWIIWDDACVRRSHSSILKWAKSGKKKGKTEDNAKI